MFSKTLNLSELRKNAKQSLEGLSKPSSREVIQLYQGKSAVKVILTQEHYFQLLDEMRKNQEQLRIDNLVAKNKLENEILLDFLGDVE